MIHDDRPLALGDGKPAVIGAVLTEIPAELKARYRAVRARQLFDELPGAVAAAVFDKDNLITNESSESLSARPERAMQQWERASTFIGGYDNR